MATVTQLLRSGSTDNRADFADASGNRGDSLYFQVTLDADETLASLVDAPGLPGYGSPHPDIPGLILDAKNVAQRWTDRVYEVRCRYSNNGRFRLPEQENEENVNRRVWEISRSASTVTIPIFRRIRTSYIDYLPNDTQGPPTTVYAYQWIREDFQTPAVSADVYREISLPSADVPTFAEVLQQGSFYHVLNSYVMRFMGASVDNRQYEAGTGQGRWQARYHWKYDPGTRALVPPDGPNRSLFAVNSIDNPVVPGTPPQDIAIILPGERAQYTDYVVTIDDVSLPNPGGSGFSLVATPRFIPIQSFAVSDIKDPSRLPGNPIA